MLKLYILHAAAIYFEIFSHCCCSIVIRARSVLLVMRSCPVAGRLQAGACGHAGCPGAGEVLNHCRKQIKNRKLTVLWLQPGQLPFLTSLRRAIVSYAILVLAHTWARAIRP